MLPWLSAGALQVNFASLLVAAERLVGHGACAARVLRAAEDGGEVLEHDSLARRGAVVRQRAPSEAGVADGLDNVDDEVAGAEGHVLDVGDVEDALKVRLGGKSKGNIFALFLAENHCSFFYPHVQEVYKLLFWDLPRLTQAMQLPTTQPALTT